MTKNYNIKITEENINNCNANIFGRWFNEQIDLETNPFPYVIIPEFIKCSSGILCHNQLILFLFSLDK